MHTRFNFKLLTAIVISLAFIFRLLFVNIGLVTSLKASPSGKRLTSHVSKLIKRRRGAEAVVKPNAESYSAVEVCEEDSDTEEDLVKALTAVLLFFLCFFFKRNDSAYGPGHSPGSLPYNLYPKRYLALSTLRL